MVKAIEQCRLERLWERAACGELLLTELPEKDRWPVRMLYSCGWRIGSGGLVSVRWPIGHVDPFAGRGDDPYLNPAVQVCFESVDGEVFCPDEREPKAPDQEGTGTVGAVLAESSTATWDDLPAGAFPFTCEAPFALARDDDAPPPAMVEQLPVSATHRYLGRWLGAPVAEYGRTKVAFGPDGSVWQTLNALDEVRRYDGDGVLISRCGGDGEDCAGFSRPIGVAVHPDGCVFVADRDNCRVQRIGPDGVIERNWFSFDPPRWKNEADEDHGVLPNYVPELDPIDIAITPDGQDVLVLDLWWRRLIRVDSSGVAVGLDQEVNRAIAVAVAPANDRIYLIEDKGSSLTWFSASDAANWFPPAHLAAVSLEDVEAAPDGTVYLVAEGESRLLWLDPDGVLLDEIPVGERTGAAPDRVGPFRLGRSCRLAAPSGVAAFRHGDQIRVVVTLHDGAILAFERPWWIGAAAGDRDLGRV